MQSKVNPNIAWLMLSIEVTVVSKHFYTQTSWRIMSTSRKNKDTGLDSPTPLDTVTILLLGSYNIHGSNEHEGKGLTG